MVVYAEEQRGRDLLQRPATQSGNRIGCQIGRVNHSRMRLIQGIGCGNKDRRARQQAPRIRFAQQGAVSMAATVVLRRWREPPGST
jgi:hypothetical protein